MKFIELATKRVSVRSYKSDPVPENLLNEILEAGRLAPTACNLQPFKFIVVRDKKRIAGLTPERYPWFADAPVIIVICTLPEIAWKRKCDNRCLVDLDAGIAIDHMTLAAAELGLGTCWIGAFDPEIVRRVLEIPDSSEPLIMLTLGTPNDTGRPKVRKPLSELVVQEKF
ncbi:MAG: nitroreductase family protein [Kiritimatiellales bacterium]